MNNNEKFECPICKNKFDNPVDMARCILKCEEQKRVEEKKKREEQLQQEKELRFNNVKKSWEIITQEIERANKLEDQLKKDYPGERIDFSEVKPNITIFDSPYIMVNGKDINGYTSKEIVELVKRVSNFF